MSSFLLLEGYFNFLWLFINQGKHVRQESYNSPRLDGFFQISTPKQHPFHHLNIFVEYWFTAFLVALFLSSSSHSPPALPSLSLRIVFSSFIISPKSITPTYKPSSQFLPHCTTDQGNKQQPEQYYSGQEPPSPPPNFRKGCLGGFHISESLAEAVCWCGELMLPHLLTLLFTNTTARYFFLTKI